MRATPVLGRAIRRLALTTKQAGKDYYKGTGTGSMGRHTKWGTYILDVTKMRTYVVPDLRNFELSPFVDRNIEPKRDNFSHTEKGPVDGLELIKQWKAAGGIR
ncbi:hypothetical protein AMS68_004570 [Peltaster fructicola]|uniref:Uncharacterized protein n=1 Tax=Peltaster fructicola TaxID=286661 RepID=A0A6H0XWC3_9PEZI|nr:hypothetical protein AMS68_004570 [Peltaster fructicola]